MRFVRLSKLSFMLVIGIGTLGFAQTQSSVFKPAASSTVAASPLYEKWVNEDVVWIIAPEERESFFTLQSDAERDEFVRQFWDRRDPTPGTPRNEFKEEHYRRIAYSNEHFASKLPGWRTDRGRTYIVKGPPKEIRANTVAGHPGQVWMYEVPGIKSARVVQFVDDCDCGEYRMK